MPADPASARWLPGCSGRCHISQPQEYIRSLSSGLYKNAFCRVGKWSCARTRRRSRSVAWLWSTAPADLCPCHQRAPATTKAFRAELLLPVGGLAPRARVTGDAHRPECLQLRLRVQCPQGSVVHHLEGRCHPGLVHRCCSGGPGRSATRAVDAALPPSPVRRCTRRSTRRSHPACHPRWRRSGHAALTQVRAG